MPRPHEGAACRVVLRTLLGVLRSNNAWRRSGPTSVFLRTRRCHAARHFQTARNGKIAYFHAGRAVLAQDRFLRSLVLHGARGVRGAADEVLRASPSSGHPAGVLPWFRDSLVSAGPRWTPKTGQSWTPENRPVR